MRTSPTDTTLHLLLGDDEGRGDGPVVLYPDIPEAAVDPIARALLESAKGGRLLLLPAPRSDAAVGDRRAWHLDMWRALPKADRDAVVFVTGSTALYLAPVLADGARTVAMVRNPLAAVASAADRMPKRRTLERLADTPASEIPARVRRISNPQSRALLAPWHDPDEMAAGAGPPADAERWREALFGEVLPRLEAATVEEAPAVAERLAAGLGARQRGVVRAANQAVDNARHRPKDAEVAELLLRFNWLDAELYERCADATERTLRVLGGGER